MTWRDASLALYAWSSECHKYFGCLGTEEGLDYYGVEYGVRLESYKMMYVCIRTHGVLCKGCVSLSMYRM